MSAGRILTTYDRNATKDEHFLVHNCEAASAGILQTVANSLDEIRKEAPGNAKFANIYARGPQ